MNNTRAIEEEFDQVIERLKRERELNQLVQDIKDDLDIEENSISYNNKKKSSNKERNNNTTLNSDYMEKPSCVVDADNLEVVTANDNEDGFSTFFHQNDMHDLDCTSFDNSNQSVSQHNNKFTSDFTSDFTSIDPCEDEFPLISTPSLKAYFEDDDGSGYFKCCVLLTYIMKKHARSKAPMVSVHSKTIEKLVAPKNAHLLRDVLIEELGLVFSRDSRTGIRYSYKVGEFSSQYAPSMAGKKEFMIEHFKRSNMTDGDMKVHYHTFDAPRTLFDQCDSDLHSELQDRLQNMKIPTTVSFPYDMPGKSVSSAMFSLMRMFDKGCGFIKDNKARDESAHRLYHSFTSIKKEIRSEIFEYNGYDTEVDVSGSIPFILAMRLRGRVAKSCEFIEDARNGRLYDRFSNTFNLSRKDAKIFMQRLINKQSGRLEHQQHDLLMKFIALYGPDVYLAIRNLKDEYDNELGVYLMQVERRVFIDPVIEDHPGIAAIPLHDAVYINSKDVDRVVSIIELSYEDTFDIVPELHVDPV